MRLKLCKETTQMKNKDIGLKVATKTEALWIKVRDNLKQRITAYEEELEVARMQLIQANDFIEEENAL